MNSNFGYGYPTSQLSQSTVQYVSAVPQWAWPYLASVDQTLNTTSSPQFAGLALTSGAFTATLQAPTLAANVAWKLPTADGAPDQVIKTDGSGNLGWATAATAFLDGSFRLKNTADNTKQLALSLAAITTGTTRTITMPDTDVDLAVVDRLKNLTTSEITQLENIGVATISATQWLHVAGMDQTVATTANAVFNTVCAKTYATAASQGAYLHWSSSGFGETHFVNHHGVSTGGFVWEDAAGAGPVTTTYMGSMLLRTGGYEYNVCLGKDCMSPLTYQSRYGVYIGVEAGKANNNLNSTYDTSRVMIGAGAGTNCTAAQGNVCIGPSAGAGAVGATGGSNNTAVGTAAMASITTGTSNTGVGMQALNSLAGAIGNTAVGNAALSVLTSGYSNVAIGNAAGSVLTTGGKNIYLGRAGAGAVDHNECVIIGDSISSRSSNEVRIGTVTADATSRVVLGAGASLSSTATGCVCIGPSAGAGGAGTTGGSNNVFVGTSSGYGVTTGASNVAVGTSAGYSIATTTYSAFLGHNAGYSTTGGSNTIIGGHSATAHNPTTGTGNVCIGCDAVTAAAGTLNAISIGNAASGAVDAIAMGRSSSASNTEAIAVGLSSVSSGAASIAVGKSSSSSGTGSIAIGNAPGASGIGGVAIGASAAANAEGATTIGWSASSGKNSVAIGHSVVASAEQCYALGYNITNATANTIRMGDNTGSISCDYRVDGTWDFLSDERLKKDIQPLSVGMQLIRELEPVKFKWNRPDETITDTMYGFTYQRMKQALHRAGVTDFARLVKDPPTPEEHGNINPARLIPILVRALQELDARIADLEKHSGLCRSGLLHKPENNKPE